jgi:hypothetical protein
VPSSPDAAQRHRGFSFLAGRPREPGKSRALAGCGSFAAKSSQRDAAPPEPSNRTESTDLTQTSTRINTMELFLKLAAAAVMIMLLFYLWPAFKAWQENGPKAQKGDWQAVVLPLAAVVGLVVILVMMVR